MKKDYSIYKLEDFIQDDDFIRWVIHPSIESNQFWKTFLDQYPEHSETIQQAKNIVTQLAIPTNAPFSSSEKEEIWHTIDAQLQTPAQLKTIRWPWMRTVAAACLMFGLLFFFQDTLFQNSNNVENNVAISSLEYVNTTTEKKEYILPDSTKIILSANSSLTLSKHYNQTSRELELKGEAFFDVIRNPEKPFIVRSNELITEVLGTSFLISAWESEKNITVKVKTGLVTLYANHGSTISPQDPIFLKPDQQANYSKDDKLLLRQNTIDISEEVVKDTPSKIELAFINTPVADILETISAYHHVTIHYDPASLTSCILTTSLVQESMLEKLDIICEAISATYEIVDGEITIHKRTNCF